MADESLNYPADVLDQHIVTLFERLEGLRRSSPYPPTRPSMQVEVRSLEFWRAIFAECVASFFYVFIVCGAAAGAGLGASTSAVLLASALASGLAMAMLTQCLSHISGAHVNPAVTVGMAVARAVSPLRAVMYAVAQCGGGIAGAALLYSVTVPGWQGNLQAALAQSAPLTAWERLGVEFALTFAVVFSHLVAAEPGRISANSAAMMAASRASASGFAYAACSFVSMPYLNPARSLGPSFVLNHWDNHWVYWFGPVAGGIISGLVYEFAFNPRRGAGRRAKDSLDGGDSCSVNSDEDTYDDLDNNKPAQPKFHGSAYNTYRPAVGGAIGASHVPNTYCPSLATASLYSAPTGKLDRVESLYGGTKSLYCKSPPLTRANLNRSQSVYTKSNSALNRELLPRPGPLVPAQSLYPMRLNQQQQQQHVQNQNAQNQLYGARRPEVQGGYGANSIYGTRTNPAGDVQNPKYDEAPKFNRGNRPESVYGTTTNGQQQQGQQQRRGQSTQSDDSSYGSYQGSAAGGGRPQNGYGSSQQPPQTVVQQQNYGKTVPRGPAPGQQQVAAPTHHAVRQPQQSPNPQY